MLERDRLFRPSWQLVGHEADIPRKGDYLTADLAGERVLVTRTAEGGIRALRNSCRKRPHALLTAERGHLSTTISCDIHGVVYELDGRLRSGDTPGDLIPLELALPGRFILVRALAARSADPASTALLEIAGAPSGDWESLPDLRPDGISALAVAADWKIMVEQWLEALPRPQGTRRTFLPPNQLLEVNAEGALLLQVIPQSPGRCLIRRLDYSVAGTDARRNSSGPQRSAGRPQRSRSRGSTHPLTWLQQDIEVAQSTQAGLAAGIDEADSAGPASATLAEFRRSIAALLPFVRSRA
jgi:nitrite reductase/ring-hydroxylating ferredoxin subunit